MSTRKTSRKLPEQKYEEAAWNQNAICIGIDEAGRGCLAGPVVAVALALHPQSYSDLIMDSKILSSAQRKEALAWIKTHAIFSVAMRSAREIDCSNILIATRSAMEEALGAVQKMITPKSAHVVIDAVQLRQTHGYPCTSMNFGEQKSLSIAAASIVAKETRDAFMLRQEELFPMFSFAKHKGYGTAAHYDELAIYGPCPLHRMSFSLIPKKDKNEQTSLFW